MQDFHPLQPEAYIENFVHSSLMERIAPFQVMILYDREKNSFDSAYLEHFPSKKVKEEVAENNIFPIIQSETFIIWQEMYEENHHLFYKLRLRARKEMMQRVTDFLVAKFFVMYETSLFPFLQTDFHRKWKFMESLHEKFERSLEKQTKLTSENAWEQFNQWFKAYLTRQVLYIMEKKYGADHLNQMPTDTINPLFFQEMNKNLSDNHSFLQEFTKMVNHYLKAGVEQFISATFEETGDLKSILQKYQIQLPLQQETKIKENYFTSMSNALYQKIIEGLSQCEGSKHTENQSLHIPIQFGQMTGEMQIDVNALSSMTGVEADVLDILVCQYVNEPDLLEKGTCIYLDNILQQRGLQPKLNGNGRRGGFEKKQRKQINDALYVLEHVYLNIKNVTVYLEGSPKTIDVEGYLLRKMKKNTEKLDVRAYFQFILHSVFQHFLIGSLRQTKLFSKQVIAYDPYRKRWEKRLGRYLSWRWRTQARKGNYIQPHKVDTLLTKINMQENPLAPSRLRDRLETSLDVLAEDGVIQSWQYESWDETIALKKGWFENWKNATLIIFPPTEIIDYYRKLTTKSSSSSKKNQHISIESKLGEKMKQKRTQMQQTQQNVADTLGISPSYLSNLERNMVNPTEKIYQDIQTWLYTM